MTLPSRVKDLLQQVKARVPLNLNLGSSQRWLRRTPLLLTLLAIVAVVGVGGAAMFGARIGIEAYELVEVQSLDFVVTTFTSETLPMEPLGKLHTFGKDYTVRFQISNSTEQLNPFFEVLTVNVRLESTGGGAWNQETSTSWAEGSVTASTGSIDMTSEHTDYVIYVSVFYSSRDQAGLTGIGLSIWAEG